MSELMTAVNVTKLNVKMYDCEHGRVFRLSGKLAMEGKRPDGRCIGMREMTAGEGEIDFLKRHKGPSNNIMRVCAIFLVYIIL